MKKILKFIKDDIKSDIETVEKLARGEIKWKFKDFKEGFGESMKKSSLWFLIVILALFVGMFASGKYYQNECNEYIYETYILPQQEKNRRIFINMSDYDIDKIVGVEKIDIFKEDSSNEDLDTS